MLLLRHFLYICFQMYNNNSMKNIVCEKLILKYVYNECGTNYKILEFEDFEDYLQNLHTNGLYDIKKILQSLEGKEFISIKYIDNNNVCLCITELGKQILYNESNEKVKHRKNRLETVFLTLLICFFAFLGAFLGTIICNLVL